MLHEGVECPKCGKHTVVRRNGDMFQCLNCDFRRDFSKFDSSFRKHSKDQQSEQENSGGGIFAIALAILGIIAVL